MSALDDRLKDARSDLEAALPASPPHPDIIVRRRQRRRVVSVGAVVVVAIVAAVTVGASTNDDGTPVVADGARPAGENADLLEPGTARRVAPGPLAGRFDAVAVWSGTHILIWGGAEGAPGGEAPLGDGAAFDPRTETWTTLPEAPIAPRSNAAAVWTGSELVIWGGSDAGTPLADGAAYDPDTQQWRMLPEAPIPSAIRPATVWTGSEMLVVGGLNAPAIGAAYNPARQQWRIIDDIPGRTPPPHARAVWAGGRAVFQLGAGLEDLQLFAYDPDADTWETIRDPGIDVAALGWASDNLLAANFSPGSPSRLLRAGSEQWQSTAATPDHGVGFTEPVATLRGVIFWSPTAGVLLDAGTGVWLVDDYELPLQPRTNTATVWADGVLFVWGGFANAADGSALGLDDGAIYRPSDTPPSETPSQWAPGSDDIEHADALGLGSWSGARTSPNGKSLVIAIIGGRRYEAGDTCTVDYRAEVTESESEVRLQIVARSPKPSGDYTCTSEGHSRLIEVGLAQALGNRRLIEAQFGREQPVFDGSQLLEPGWLPADWSLLYEAPGYPEPESARYWRRTWGQPSPPPTDNHCTPSPTPVTLTQGPADLVDRYPSNGERPTDRYEVRGHQATYFTGGSANVTRLAWTEGDRGYVLASGDRCAGDAPPAAELLLRIADSLRQP